MQKTEIIEEPLFVGVTRPTMPLGVTFEIIIFNIILASILFLGFNNILMMLLIVPLHIFGMVLCSYDANIMNLIEKWSITKSLAIRTKKQMKKSFYFTNLSSAKK